MTPVSQNNLVEETHDLNCIDTVFEMKNLT